MTQISQFSKETFMKKKICIAIILILIGACIALLCVELAGNNWVIEPAQLMKPAIILIGLVLSLVKLITSGATSKRSLHFYESAYQKEIGKAFSPLNQKKEKKALLKAIALYNENRYKKAIVKLTALKAHCKSRDDFRTVLLFLALNYSDCGLQSQAADAYLELLRHDNGCSTAWSNLGILYKNEGKAEEALHCYQNAVLYDDNNPIAWNNLAQAYLTAGKWEEVIKPAERALFIKANLHSAESALSIAYCALGHEENCKIYYRRAILHGANTNQLTQILENISLGKNPFQ